LAQVPDKLFYSASHQWLALDADGTARVGITDFAQEALGDVVFVEFPSLGQAVTKDQACAVVESVKSASDVFSPLSGTVIEINAELESAPEKINQAPYDAWLFKLKLSDVAATKTLLAPAAYRDITE
jgi:glycine cleavage system H protein